MKPSKLTVRARERYDEEVFSIIRLSGVGAGVMCVGDVVRVCRGSQVITEHAEVVSVEDRLLSELSDADAERLLRPPTNSSQSLRALLEGLYKARPTWRWENTEFRLLTLRRDS